MKKIISHVVALSNNNVIGVDNMLPWNLKRDLQHFKNYTTNKILLMGRKTYESIGRPLPNRINYVISTTIDEIDGAEVFKSIDDALDAANKKCDDHNEYNEIVWSFSGLSSGLYFAQVKSDQNQIKIIKVVVI